MIHFDANVSVMIAISPIDFRVGLNKLAAITEILLKENPEQNGIFVFRNKRRTDIKIIFYDDNGYFLGHKRLSKGKLSWWPRNEHESLNVSSHELVKLLKGVDPRGGFNPELEKIKTKAQGFGKKENNQYQPIRRGAFEPQRED